MNANTAFQRRISRQLHLALLILLLYGPLPAFSKQETSPGQDDFVPGRLRTLEGDAVLQREQEQDRVEATRNLPLYPGDVLETTAGRAEIQLPDGSMVWLDRNSRIEFAALGNPDDPNQEGTVLRLRAGVVGIHALGRIQGSGEKDFRVFTPKSTVYLLGGGLFRIETDENATTVTSSRGVAEVVGEGESTLVRSGERTRISRGSGPANPWAVNTLRKDDFDAWCENRLEDSYAAEESAGDDSYLEEIPAPVRRQASELDRYGDWQSTVEFGWVWRPTVYGVGWRPYYNGYWTWYPSGWTWVAYEPWGWAPYHYGRWSYITSTGWVWVPGGVYSGAWVSWAVTPSYIGWAPLDYYNQPVFVSVNVTNITVNHFGAAWNFLPTGRFCERNSGRISVRSGSVPELRGAVTTRSLPRFSPSLIKGHSEEGGRLYRSVRESPGPDPAQRSADRDRRVSFRESDQREAKVRRGPGQRKSPAVSQAAGASPTPPPRTPTGSRASTSSASSSGRREKAPSVGASPGSGNRAPSTRTIQRSPGRGAGSRAPSRPTVGEGPDTRRNPLASGRTGESKRPDERSGKSLTGTAPFREDPSSRVLGRIRRDRQVPTGPTAKGSGTTTLIRNEDRSRSPRQEVQAPRPRPSAPRAETTRAKPSPPKRETPPPRRSGEKKKGKP